MFTLLSRPVRHVAIVTLMTLLFSGAVVAANNLFRYKDEKGQTVIGFTITQDAVSRGYDILSPNGRVIETVPPALTDEQIAARDHALAEMKRRSEELAKQKADDERLLKTYSHPDDAVRARDRRLQEIEALIRFKEGSLEMAQTRLEADESRAADMQRSGRAVPDDMIRNIATSKQQIDDLKKDISDMMTEKKSTAAAFEATISRLEHLTEKKRTKTTP